MEGLLAGNDEVRSPTAQCAAALRVSGWRHFYIYRFRINMTQSASIDESTYLCYYTYMGIYQEVYNGDAREVLSSLADDSVDLIVTSPPYADQRKNTYGGIAPDEYVDWFLPISWELLCVLKPIGTFILNIKEKVVNGERSTYVLGLILEMCKQGWLWTEEFIWHKKNCYPGKWPNRFRDAWERLLQFNKSRQFTMYQEAVMSQWEIGQKLGCEI